MYYKDSSSVLNCTVKNKVDEKLIRLLVYKIYVVNKYYSFCMVCVRVKYA